MRNHCITSRRYARRIVSGLLVVSLVGWSGFAIALTGMALSPSQVGVGGTSTGTVTLDVAPLKGSVTVQLFSQHTTIATVPSSVTFSSLTKQSSRTFNVSTLAAGCSEIKALLNGVGKTALLTVQPPANPTGAPLLSFSSNSTLAGVSVTGTVSVVGAQSGTFKISLASNSPAATGPSASAVAWPGCPRPLPTRR